MVLDTLMFLWLFFKCHSVNEGESCSMCIFLCSFLLNIIPWALLRDCLYPGGAGGKDCDANPAQEVFGLFQLCELEE